MIIPRTLDDITAEWCGDALGRTITAVDIAPLGVGIGLVGQLFRNNDAINYPKPQRGARVNRIT